MSPTDTAHNFLAKQKICKQNDRECFLGKQCPCECWTISVCVLITGIFACITGVMAAMGLINLFTMNSFTR